MKASALSVVLLAASGCLPLAAQLDEKPPVLKRGDGTPGRSSKKDDSSKDADIVKASGILRQINDKTIQVESDDTRLLTCNLNRGTTLSGPSGKLTIADFEPGMRVSIRAKPTEDGEELNAISVELDNPSSKPADLKTATIQEPPDEEGRPILRRGIPAKRKSPDTSDDDDAAEAKVTPPAETVEATSSPSQPATSKETLETLTGEGARQALIQKARQATGEFSSHLPNFVCQQFTTRYKRETRQSGWQAEDVVTATVVYVDGKEDYQNIKVGSRASTKGMMDIKGQRSVGEFGLILDSLMDSSHRAEFHFVKDAEMKHLKTKVYDFSVKRENSDWNIEVAGESILPAYSGRVWIALESGRVLRLERQADKIPESFPNDTVEQTIDYDFVMIGTHKVLLPTESENLACERGTSYCRKNVIAFRNYREFRGEATLDFEK